MSFSNLKELKGSCDLLSLSKNGTKANIIKKMINGIIKNSDYELKNG